MFTLLFAISVTLPLLQQQQQQQLTSSLQPVCMLLLLTVRPQPCCVLKLLMMAELLIPNTTIYTVSATKLNVWIDTLLQSVTSTIYYVILLLWISSMVCRQDDFYLC